MDEEQLILEVQKNPVLYDKSHHMFKDARKKKDIWNEIGSKVEVSGETAKKKWTNIRDAFQNNRKKNGDGAKKNIRCYKYAGILGFLIPFIQNRETSTNLDTLEEGSDSVGNGQEELERSDDEDSLLSIDTSASSTPSPGLSQSLRATPSSSTASYSSRKRRQNSTENAVDLSIVEYLKSRKTTPDKPDEITEFFNSMAISVKKFPELQQAVVKFKIHQIVHEMEMEILFAKPHPKHQTGLLSQQPHIQTGPIQTGPQSNQFSHPPYQVSQGMPQHHQFQQSTSLANDYRQEHSTNAETGLTYHSLS